MIIKITNYKFCKPICDYLKVLAKNFLIEKIRIKMYMGIFILSSKILQVREEKCDKIIHIFQDICAFSRPNENCKIHSSLDENIHYRCKLLNNVFDTVIYI